MDEQIELSVCCLYSRGPLKFNVEGQMLHPGRHPRPSKEIHTWLLSRDEKDHFWEGYLGIKPQRPHHRSPWARSPSFLLRKRVYILGKAHSWAIFLAMSRHYDQICSHFLCLPCCKAQSGSRNVTITLEIRSKGSKAAHSDWEREVASFSGAYAAGRESSGWASRITKRINSRQLFHWWLDQLALLDIKPSLYTITYIELSYKTHCVFTLSPFNQWRNTNLDSKTYWSNLHRPRGIEPTSASFLNPCPKLLSVYGCRIWGLYLPHKLRMRLRSVVCPGQCLVYLDMYESQGDDCLGLKRIWI